MAVASATQLLVVVPDPKLATATVEPVAVPMERAAWLAAVPTTPADKSDPNGWYQRTLSADAATRAVNVLSLAMGSLSPRERAETHTFARHTLEPMDPHLRPFALPADRYTWAAPTWSVMVKADQRVVTHVGILYRVIKVGEIRVPVGGITSVMTQSGWRGRGYARAALARATAFAAVWLWAPFALTICPRKDTGFYEMLGWRVAEAPIWCQQPRGRVRLEDEVGVFLPCQGDAEWPSGPIDLYGPPW
jgi:GNAT superfamily N-acetyltransferase